MTSLLYLGTMYANGGIPLKYAPDGSVAIATEPRPTQIFDGKEYVMEMALRPDVSLVKAFKADTRGNLIFRGTSQNANPDCAVAGKVVLVSNTVCTVVRLSASSFNSNTYSNTLGRGRDNSRSR